MFTLDPGVETKPEVRWHFAVPIYSKVIGAYGERREAFVELLDRLQADSPGVKKSNLNTWHSAVNVHLMKEEFHPLEANLSYSRSSKRSWRGPVR